jgi:predicted phage terminase large subunit-like protein
VINPSRFSIVKKVNYYDNPWFFDNHALVIEKEDRFERNREKFNHIWLGGTTTGINQIFNPNWWNRYDDRSAAIAQCTASFITADTAYKTKQNNDYSVIQHWGYNRYQLYLLNQIRGKWAFPDLVRMFKKFTIESTRLAQRCPPQRVYIEDKASGISLVQTLQVDGINAVPWKPKDFQFPEDKVGRAKEASLYIERGCVYIPTNESADWARGFINEHSDFDPEQEGFDDQVDAETMAVSIYRERGGGIMADQIRV